MKCEPTKRESEILNAIISYISEHQYAPTVREICEMTGLKSTSSVHNHLCKMIENGILETDGGRERLGLLECLVTGLRGRCEMKRNKSAKDLAFEKERAKYRKKIRELELDITRLKMGIMQKENEINVLQQELLQKKDWIIRLLEYTELSEDDMKNIMEKEKNTAEIMKHLSDFGKIFSVYGRKF